MCSSDLAKIWLYRKGSMITLRHMAVKHCPDALLAAMREELESRGVSHAQLWAVVVCCHGLKQASERFTLMLGESLAKAKIRCHNEAVMDGVQLGD